MTIMVALYHILLLLSSNITIRLDTSVELNHSMMFITLLIFMSIILESLATLHHVLLLSANIKTNKSDFPCLFFNGLLVLSFSSSFIVSFVYDKYGSKLTTRGSWLFHFIIIWILRNVSLSGLLFFFCFFIILLLFNDIWSITFNISSAI